MRWRSRRVSTSIGSSPRHRSSRHIWTIRSRGGIFKRARRERCPSPEQQLRCNDVRVARRLVRRTGAYHLPRHRLLRPRQQRRLLFVLRVGAHVVVVRARGPARSARHQFHRRARGMRLQTTDRTGTDRSARARRRNAQHVVGFRLRNSQRQWQGACRYGNCRGRSLRLYDELEAGDHRRVEAEGGGMHARVLTHPALARQRFVEIAQSRESELDLVEASLVIALEDRPTLDIAPYLDRVGAWSEAVRQRLEGSHDVDRIVDAINRLLFDEEGFHGEDDDYYDPRSALVSEMLDRHAGIPITLSILYLELSRRVGVDAVGVSLPGRFLVKFGDIVIDPFDGGRVLTTIELQKILDVMYGGGVRLREHHLRSFSRKEILMRELAHLKAAYLAQHDLPHAAASIDRLLILDARDAYEVRDRAALAMQMHAYATAIDCLERYLALMPYADDRNVVR